MPKQYRCIRRCYHRKLYEIGDLAIFPDGDPVPHHFVLSEQFSRAAVEQADLEDRKKKVVGPKIRTQKSG